MASGESRLSSSAFVASVRLSSAQRGQYDFAADTPGAGRQYRWQLRHRGIFNAKLVERGLIFLSTCAQANLGTK
jgi:hypothetical protein